jgi:hypothetical protein
VASYTGGPSGPAGPPSSGAERVHDLVKRWPAVLRRVQLKERSWTVTRRLPMRHQAERARANSRRPISDGFRSSHRERCCCVFRGKPNSIPGLVEHAFVEYPFRAGITVIRSNEKRKPSFEGKTCQRLLLFGGIPECCSTSSECAVATVSNSWGASRRSRRRWGPVSTKHHLGFRLPLAVC